MSGFSYTQIHLTFIYKVWYNIRSGKLRYPNSSIRQGTFTPYKDSKMYIFLNLIVSYLFVFFVGWKIGADGANSRQQKKLARYRKDRRSHKLRSTQENVSSRIANAIADYFGSQFVVQVRADASGSHHIVVVEYMIAILHIEVDMLSSSKGDIRWNVSGGKSVRFHEADKSAQDVISFTSLYLGRTIDSRF